MTYANGCKHFFLCLKQHHKCFWPLFPFVSNKGRNAYYVSKLFLIDKSWEKPKIYLQETCEKHITCSLDFYFKNTLCVPLEKPFVKHKTCLEIGFSRGNTTWFQQCIICIIVQPHSKAQFCAFWLWPAANLQIFCWWSVSRIYIYIHKIIWIGLREFVGSCYDFDLFRLFSHDQRQLCFKDVQLRWTQKNALGFIPRYCLMVKLSLNKKGSNED